MFRPLLAMTLVTILWAGNFAAAKIGTGPEGFSPFIVASVRIFVAAAGFYMFLPRDQKKIRRSDILGALPLALTGIAINQTCFAAGIKITTPSHSALVHALIPIFVSIFAWALIKETLRGVAIIGMVIAVAGALGVLFGESREEFQGTIAGDLLTVAGMTAFSLYTVLGRRLITRMGSYRAVTLAFVLAVPFMIPVFAIGCIQQDWHAVTWRGGSALIYMIIGATFITYAFHLYALTRLKAGQVAIFTDLQPALGTSIAVLMGLDHVTLPLIAGGVVALAGVALVQLFR